MSSLHFKNQSSMVPMHTHRETSVQASPRLSALRIKKVGPKLTHPPPAVVFFSPVLLSSGPSVSLAKGSSRRQKQTEILFANPNPGKKKIFPSRNKETVVKKGVV